MPRDSSRTVVVSAGRLDGVTDSFGWVDGLGAHLVEELGERLGAVGLVLAHAASARRSAGSSWAISAAALVGVSGPPSGTQAMSTGPMSPSFSSDSRWPMSPRWIVWTPSTSTTNETRLPRSRPARVVAVGPDAGDQDLLDLVLAGAVEDERVVEARRQERRAVARRLPLALRQRLCRRGG